MIRIVYHSSPEDKKKFFRENKSTADIWLVAHLEAKRAIQNVFLEDSDVLTGQSVQRASEYWNWLFSVNCPDWTVVSDSLIFAWLEEWFEAQDIDSRFRDIQLFTTFFAQFLPVLDGDQKELFEEWLAADPQRSERLSPWYEQADQFWNFLREKKSLPRHWLLTELLKKENINFGSAKDFYVDLGTDLQQQEVEFLIKMSVSHDIHVLVPQAPWTGEYATLFSVYKKLIEESETAIAIAPEKAQTQPLLEVGEVSSVVREVKVAVAQVRAWLEQGMKPSEIGILSPVIEDYWDLLREHMIVEGVPLQKRFMGKSISLPYVQTWLSRLHLLNYEFRQADLENYVFDQYKNQNGEAISYSEFKKNYSFLYEEDRIRNELTLPKSYEPGVRLSLSAVIDILYKQWPVENKDVIDNIADQFIQDIGLDHEFSFSLWLKYLEMLLSRHEWAAVAEEAQGLGVLPLSHGDWTSYKCMIVLGCTQNNLREQIQSPATAVDIFALENDLGIVLQRVEQSKKEFDLRWQMEDVSKKSVLLRSETDFEGQPQTASSYWLSLEDEHKKTFPEITRWDQVMSSAAPQGVSELGWASEEQAVVDHKLAMESNLDSYVPVKKPAPVSVSASSLGNFFQCGFKFYADKVLKIDEPKIYDLDIDFMYQGQLLHAILEEMGKRDVSLDLSHDELEIIYDEAVARLKDEMPVQNFWLHEKQRHFQYILNFIELEKAWRLQFPGTKILSTETSIRGYVGRVNGEIVFSAQQLSPEQYLLRGKIDRIDQDEQGYLGITDYKASQNSHIKSVNKWAENGQFQMPLYALALEKGLSPDIPAQGVVAAQYLFLKDKKRGSGFVLNDVDHQLGDVSSKRLAQNIASEKREELFADILKVLGECLDRISKGDFPPIPKDFDVCKTCHWSTICRAPHLR